MNLVKTNTHKKWIKRVYTGSIHILCAGILLFVGSVQSKFIDVDVTHPNFHAVEMLQKQNIVEGYREGKNIFYRPLQPVIRAEALKVLLLASDTQVAETEGHYFPDVPFNAWYTNFVNTAGDLGIVKGFADGNFHPAAQVSRAEFLKMLTLSFHVPVDDQQPGEEWYERFFRVAGNYRILDDREASPYESVTRGEMAELIFRTQWVARNNFEKKYVYSGSGQASYYNEGFAGNNTASGEIYDPDGMTAAHRTLPFGTYVKVWYGDKFVVVRINDRGPYHEKRILDLSQKAFERLAPISRGVIDVDFEVILAPSETNPEIPAFIQPSFSSVSQNEPVPSVVAKKLEYHPLVVREEAKNNEPAQPLFDGVVSHLAKDFFPGVTLRRSIPQKMFKGTVLNFSGTVDASGKKKAIVFLQKIEDGEKTGKQIHFSGVVSGRNFGFPVMFTESGIFQIGLVFDEDRRSRVEEIEIVGGRDGRTIPSLEGTFTSELDIRVVPEEKTVRFKWTGGRGLVSRIVFQQKNVQEHLLIEDGLGEITLPYEFFHVFSPGDRMRIQLSQALSNEATLEKQSTAWSITDTETFLLIPGFRDLKNEKVSLSHFPRFVKSLDPIVLEGTIQEKEASLASHVFVIRSDGVVQKFPIQMWGLYQFQTRIQFEDWGTYGIEFVSSSGEVLFNRGMYVWKEYVLPVFPWPQTEVTTNTISGIRHWINLLRRKYELSAVSADRELNEFAQNYAERMADENFISHITPEGMDFKQRIEGAGMRGEFGENLGFGTTLELALSGLENSASHRDNILKDKWTRVGIGLMETDKGYYVTQVFGK